MNRLILRAYQVATFSREDSLRDDHVAIIVANERSGRLGDVDSPEDNVVLQNLIRHLPIHSHHLLNTSVIPVIHQVFVEQ